MPFVGVIRFHSVSCIPFVCAFLRLTGCLAKSHFSSKSLLNKKHRCNFVHQMSFIKFCMICQQMFVLCLRSHKRECTMTPCLPRKEVIQPHLPIRLPCYDFTPVINPTFDAFLLAVRSAASGIANSHGVTGGVYKTRERIHRDILIRDY